MDGISENNRFVNTVFSFNSSKVLLICNEVLLMFSSIMKLLFALN